jgi:hypothetical protein
MNCSILRFDRIGHIDHPGTPFQVFLGFCIDLIYLVSGKDSVVSDVLARPEHYLSWCSNMMAVAFTLILFWAGKIGKKYSGWTGGFFLQISPFLSPILLDLSQRIMADRFAMILVFILIISLIKYNSKPAKSGREEASLGLLSGIIIATKVSFLPVLLIPFLILKKKIVFTITTLLGFLFGILPILNHYKDFYYFIKSLIFHDGIYGAGSEQFLDTTVFLQNILLILQSNVLLVMLLLISGGYLISALVRRTSIWKSERLVLMAFMAAGIASILLVAKHYKNYYIAPMLMTLGYCLYVLEIGISSKSIRSLLAVTAVCFSTFSVYKEIISARTKSEIVKTRIEAAEELNELRTSGSYLVIKPEWLWGPAEEYGLIFGLSYVRHRFVYQPEIDAIYPDALSYEGPGQNLRKMRLEEISDSTIISEGRTIFLVDQQARRAKEIINDLAGRLNYQTVDSSFLSNKDKVFRLEPILQIK